MNRTPAQVPPTPIAAKPRQAQSRPGDAAQRHHHRRVAEPARAAVERRWRFTDAVAAARQLSAGDAAS
jgi:hypothetical protein